MNYDWNNLEKDEILIKNWANKQLNNFDGSRRKITMATDFRCKRKRFIVEFLIIIHSFLMDRNWKNPRRKSNLRKSEVDVDSVGRLIFMARTHEIAFERRRWRVRRAVLRSSPHDKCQTHNISGSRKNPVFAFSMHNAVAVATTVAVAATTTFALIHFHICSVRFWGCAKTKRNEWNVRAVNICISCCGPMSR